MKRDVTRTQSGRADRIPSTRRSNFFSPWFDDYWEPARFFDDFFNRDLPVFSGNARSLAPAIDVDETADEYVVSADLPGIKKEDINIEYTGNQLTISAERKQEMLEGQNPERRERFYGTYQRSFTLPVGVETDKIAANYDGGVLTVHLPKGEKVKAKRIQIAEAKAVADATDKH